MLQDANLTRFGTIPEDCLNEHYILMIMSVCQCSKARGVLKYISTKEMYWLQT